MKHLLFLIFLLTTLSATAQKWKDTAKLIDKILERYPANGPGAQIAVSRNGKLLYSSARGMANLEDSVPLTTQSIIEAGSVSKQFTAASILLLEQQGKLSLKDDIRKYLPELRDYGHTITIQHLMNHTSGLKDWGSIAEIAGWPRTTKVYNNNDALYIIARQQTLNNIPGDEYIYSNSNYNLMAIIVQRVSGMSLATFSKQYIFTPAGMTHTEWRDNHNRIVRGRAIAYIKTLGNYQALMPTEDVYGNGGLLTTAEDLLAWNNYYLNGKLGAPSLLPRQIATVPFNNGKPHTYAAGLMIDTLNGRPAITHSGATAAYRANLDYFPQLGLSIAWLSNTAQAELSNIPAQVRNLLVPYNATARNPVRDTAAIIDPALNKESTLQTYTGIYYSEEAEATLHVVLKDGKLQIYTRPGQEQTLKPIKKDGFTFSGGRVDAERDTQGNPNKLFITVSRARRVMFIKQ